MPVARTEMLRVRESAGETGAVRGRGERYHNKAAIAELYDPVAGKVLRSLGGARRRGCWRSRSFVNSVMVSTLLFGGEAFVDGHVNEPVVEMHHRHTDEHRELVALDVENDQDQCA